MGLMNFGSLRFLRSVIEERFRSKTIGALFFTVRMIFKPIGIYSYT